MIIRYSLGFKSPVMDWFQSSDIHNTFVTLQFYIFRQKFAIM